MIPSAFLQSKVARRIAFLLLLAAAIPALLVSGLAHRNMARLIHEYEHQSLRETARNQALNTFSNLLFAKSTLLQFGSSFDNIETLAEDFLAQREARLSHTAIFTSVSLVSADGQLDTIITNQGNNYVRSGKKQMMDTLEWLRDIKQTTLRAVPQQGTQGAPAIMLIVPTNKPQIPWLLAELNPDFIWGNQDEFSTDFKVCAYSGTDRPRLELFCSTTTTVRKDEAVTAKWELFINVEFQTKPWVFEITRLKPSAASSLLNFYDSNGYAGVVILSLLIIGLLSLTQIRRTMVPLERLIEGTRKIAQGNFDTVQVDGKSEFSELASAFNQMSSNIQRQMNTLQVFSQLDKKMVAKLDVDHLVEQITRRVQSLKPDAHVQIFRITELTDTEALCQANTAYNGTLSSYPISLPAGEIHQLKSSPEGFFTHPNIQLRHQQEIAALGLPCLWVLPIFWQGTICGLLTIGSQTPLAENDSDLDEIRDLSNRIGIAISAQKREEQLLIQAHHDLLTGLPNRILLDDRLQQAIEHSRRTHLPTWVLFLDLDRFKHINDSMGHHLGDQVLITLSRRLRETIRENDTIARFGGDEFIVVLQGHENQDLMMSEVYKIIESVITPLHIGQHEINITCSIGIATCPQDGVTPNTLIQHADIAMYRAKELGKNNFQFFTQALNQKVAERIRIENLLRHAIERNELVLHYQPKVNLKTMRIVGMEALIRWNSQELGFVSPMQFIQIAEEIGLIIPIGEWVIKTACAQAVAWQKAGFGKILMSVNVSARQFSQPNLLASIESILAETGLEARHLELELTESVVMTEASSSINILDNIKALGIKVAIDDFGTGYSSLAYLKDLPLDTLKIDKSFIDAIVTRADSAPIVQTMISLAKNLNLNIIAEGIESQEQALWLQVHDCNEAQGYYFSKPMPADAIERILLTRFDLNEQA